MLSYQDIKELVLADPPMIEDYTDLEVQLQQCGFDLTLDYVEYPGTGRRDKATVIDFTNEKRRLVPMSRAEPMSRDGIFWFYLDPGHYVFHSTEVIRVPADIGGHAHIRSSLQRAGIIASSALFDPGFYGHLTLSVSIPYPGLKIMRGARYCQLTFWKLSTPTDKLYEGVYNERKT
jgi:dUTP pyrophosphatase